MNTPRRLRAAEVKPTATGGVTTITAVGPHMFVLRALSRMTAAGQGCTTISVSSELIAEGSITTKRKRS